MLSRMAERQPDRKRKGVLRKGTLKDKEVKKIQWGDLAQFYRKKVWNRQLVTAATAAAPAYSSNVPPLFFIVSHPPMSKRPVLPSPMSGVEVLP
jgi:hypothetical protein